MKLYKVSAILTAKGLEIEAIEWEAIEKKVTFFISKENGGYTSSKHLKKDRIGRLSTGLFTNSTTHIGFEVWCHEKDIPEWKIACERSVIKTLRLYQSQLNDLAKHIQ